jgi:hypothetical protein
VGVCGEVCMSCGANEIDRLPYFLLFTMESAPYSRSALRKPMIYARIRSQKTPIVVEIPPGCPIDIQPVEKLINGSSPVKGIPWHHTLFR